MARVTVEDCKKIVNNHFELVVLASRRGRDIASGSPILVERSNDKNAVVALREIAAKKLNVELLRENLLNDYRERLPEDDDLSDNQQEDYLELEADTDTKHANHFDEDFAEIDDFAAIEIDDEEISFEDQNLNVED